MSNLLILENKSKIVKKDDNWECYVWSATNLKLRGITKRLKKRFYPCVRKGWVVPKKKTQTGGPKLVKGIKGGKLVHGQVELFVEHAKRGTLNHFTKENNPDPRLIKIVNEIIARKYQLLYSEYKVGSKELRLGTGVDILCMDEDGGIIVIEIKTGYESGYIGPSTQRMNAPFETLDRSSWAQHQLQLLATSQLFSMTTGLKIAGSYVWVVNSKPRPVIYPLHPGIINRGEELLIQLAAKVEPVKKRVFITRGNSKRGKARH